MVKQKNKLILILVLLVILILTLRMVGVSAIFSLQNLIYHRDQLLNFVDQHYLSAVLMYLLIYIAVVTVNLPIIPFLMIAGGLLFGFEAGLIYTLLGAVLGAIGSFWLLKYFFNYLVSERVLVKLNNFNRDLQRFGALYLLSLNLLSIVPFFIVNSLAVLGRVSLWTFIWTTAVGVMPLAILLTYMGRQLGKFSSIKDILTVPVLVLFVSLAILSFLPVLVVKLRERKNRS